MATKKPEVATTETIVGPKPIFLRGLTIQRATIRVRGTSRLVVHAFDEKSKQQLRDLYGQKAREKKEPKDPEGEYLRARYIIEGKDAVRAIAVKAAVATAALLYEKPLTKALVHRALHINHEWLPIEGTPVMREDVTRLHSGMKTVPDLRYRPEYYPWSLVVPVEFFPRLLPLDSILELFNTAGAAIGICEHRPDKGGMWGRFEVEGVL